MGDTEQSKLVDEILLCWEREETAQSGAPKTIEAFCMGFTGATEPVVSEVKRRISALEFMDHFLSGNETGGENEFEQLVGQSINLQKTLAIESQVARGGRAVILKAHDQLLDRYVAIKTLLDQDYSTQSGRERLTNEAHTIGRLEHPGILPILDAGQLANKVPLYSMPLVDGQSMKEAIDNLHKMPTGEIHKRELNRLIRLFISICQTVAYAHSRDIVHRDIKPGNIMLGKFGEAFLVDWGLCKNVNAPDIRDHSAPKQTEFSAIATQTGNSLGTPAFMSPEQAAAETKYDQKRSDIFNLGATLYSILTGIAPYDGPSIIDVLTAARKRTLQPPRKIDPSIDKALEAICLKAMAREPDKRYANPTELIDDVERWFRDEPVSARCETFVSHTLRFIRHNSTSVLVASIALITLVIVGSFFAFNLDQQRLRADRNAELAWNTVNQTIAEVRQNQLLKYGGFRPLRTKLLTASLEKYDRLLNESNQLQMSAEQLALAQITRGQIYLETGEHEKASEDLNNAIPVLIEEYGWLNDERRAKLAKFWVDQYEAAAQNENDKHQQEIITQFTHSIQKHKHSIQFIELYLELLTRKAQREIDKGEVENAKRTTSDIEAVISDINPSDITPLTVGKIKLVNGKLKTAEQDLEAAEQVTLDSVTYLERAISSVKDSLEASIAKNSALKTLVEIQEQNDKTSAHLQTLEKHATYLRELIAQFPSILQFRQQYLDAAFALTNAYQAISQWSDALRTLDTAKDYATGDKLILLQIKSIELHIAEGNWHRGHGRSSEAMLSFTRAKSLAENKNLVVDSKTLIQLTQSLLLIGYDQWTAGKDRDALQTYQSAQNVVMQLPEESMNVDILELGAITIMGQALSYAMLDEPEKAVQLCRKTINQLKQVSELRDKSGGDENHEQGNLGLETSHFLLACALERIGDQSFQNTRKQSAQYRPKTNDGIVELARIYALESQLFGRGKREFKQSDRFLIKRYHDKIIALLTAAKEKGFNDFASIEADPAYFALYKETEFRNLLEGEKSTKNQN